jgi:hypothetical protein
VTVNRNVARSLDATGQDEAALTQWNRTMEFDPNHLRSQVPFALLLLEHGRTDLGWQQLERARALQPDDPAVLASLAIASVESGKADQARRLLAKLEEESARRYVSPVFPAFVHTALGDKDRAFALLEKAYDSRDPLLIEIQSMNTPVGLRPPPERAAALRADPRFADLVRRMGFPRRDAAGGPSTPASGAPGGRRWPDLEAGRGSRAARAPEDRRVSGCLREADAAVRDLAFVQPVASACYGLPACWRSLDRLVEISM